MNRKYFYLFVVLFLFFNAIQVNGQTKDTLRGTIRVKKDEIKLFAAIAGKRGGNISPMELCSNPVLLNDSNVKLVGFSISFTLNGKLYSGAFKGENIEGDYCRMIYTLKSGSKFIVENIKVKGKEALLKEVPTMVFIIDGTSQQSVFSVTREREMSIKDKLILKKTER